MRKTTFTLLAAIAFTAFTSSASESWADIASSVWTTGVANPTDGAFGSPGSVSSNEIAGTITSNGATANVSLTANNSDFFRTTGSPNITNDELAPIFENDAPLTTLSFTSDIPLNNFDLLVHNVWNQGGTNAAQNARLNYIGNFDVFYENGLVVTNILPTVRPIDVDSPFSTDLLNGTLQPTDLDSAFDGGNLLEATASAAFDPGNGADPATYFFDPSQSNQSESQGFGIFSFDDTNGGISRVDFTWVGHTEGSNTAFLGFAGTLDAPDTSAVPEPSASLVMLFGAFSMLHRRRR